jgi:hypothetical protein
MIGKIGERFILLSFVTLEKQHQGASIASLVLFTATGVKDAFLFRTRRAKCVYLGKRD